MARVPHKRRCEFRSAKGLSGVSLLIAVIATATGYARDDGLEVFEQIESDPVLQEQLALDDALSEAWLDAMTCEFLGSTKPRVRLHASLSLSFRPVPLTCAETGGPVDPRAIRERIAAHSDDAATLHAIYLADCDSDRARLMNSVFESNGLAADLEADTRAEPAYCESSGIPDSLRKLDPNNAAVRLLPVLSLGEPPQPSNYASYRPVVVDASGAGRFDLYFMRGSLEVYDEIADYMGDHPPPDLSRRIGDLLEPLGSQEMLRSPWWMGQSILFSASVHDHFASASRLSGFCHLARTREDDVALEACWRLAGMLEKEQTYMGQHFGQALRWRLESPLGPGPNGEAYAYQWKNRLRALEMECQQPRHLHDFKNWNERREQDIRLYVADLSSTGERYAVVQAALREQQRGLVERQVDPARCQELWTLDEESQRDLLELMNGSETETERYGEAMKGLAEALRIGT